MPLIIDANRAGDFTELNKVHAIEIIRRVAANRLKIVIGGQLTSELFNTKLRLYLIEWQRAGRLVRFSDEDVERCKRDCESKPIRSDDPHVLGLAIVSGSRLLYTDDRLLIQDFKNIDLIRPKGKAITTRTPIRRANDLLNSV